jgi:hypothetical protein
MNTAPAAQIRRIGILPVMATERGELFADFSHMPETVPLKNIGERVRNAW